jgi:hypothetical protein
VSMNSNLPEQFLLDQIPNKIRRLIPQKLRIAYEAAELLVGNTPMLQIPTAKDDRGRINSWAVDFAIKGLIESQEWSADFRWQPFARPTGVYLEIILPHSRLTISQVPIWNEQPRNVVFRQNARLGNYQFRLPGFETDEDDASGATNASGPISLLLVHGYKQLEFAHIGIPQKHHEMGYIYQTPNLMRMLYEVAPPESPPPEVEVNLDELMSLKEEIERRLRDDGGA